MRALKTRIVLEREIKNCKRRLEKLIQLEKRSRKVWTKAYNLFLKAANQLVGLKVHHTKKEADLKKKIKDWPAETIRLTSERDAFRKQIEQAKDKLAKLGTKLATLKE